MRPPTGPSGRCQVLLLPHCAAAALCLPLWQLHSTRSAQLCTACFLVKVWLHRLAPCMTRLAQDGNSAMWWPALSPGCPGGRDVLIGLIHNVFWTEPKGYGPLYAHVRCVLGCYGPIIGHVQPALGQVLLTGLAPAAM